MKKVLIILAAASCILAATSCNSSQKNNQRETNIYTPEKECVDDPLPNS